MKKFIFILFLSSFFFSNISAETIYGGPKSIEDAKKLFEDRELDLIEGLWSSKDGSIYAVIKKNNMEYMEWTVDHVEKRFNGESDSSTKIIKSANPNIYAYHFTMYNPENPSEEALNRSTIIIKDYNLYEYRVPRGCYSEGRCWDGYESFRYRLWPANSSEISSSEGPKSSGTAFFINSRGNLLTNNHVVEGCNQLNITYKNKDYKTKIIAKDKTLDLALLKAEINPKSYFAFAKDETKKLNKIYVAGYPFGKGLSDDLKISSGIISSLKGFDDNSNEIQIDAPINPGNSGGPIINENGSLVAIAVSGLAKDQTEGINFGIKSSAAQNFLKSNNINPKISMYSGIQENDKLLEILEEGTVYTYCD